MSMATVRDPLTTSGVQESLDFQNDKNNENPMVRGNLDSATQGLRDQVQPLLASDARDNTDDDQVLHMRESSFIAQFAATNGPPQIALLIMLLAVGLGSTVGVVPAVMTDRFARLDHGYNYTASCSSFDLSSGNKPQACFLGSADAQNAAASSNLISNVLTFLTSSLLGSLSDEYGRKGIMVAGLFLSCGPSLMLVLIQLIPNMSPWWYYNFSASTGAVNWIAVALSALSDVLPQHLRAPGVGLLLAGFSLGISLSPVLTFFLDRVHLTIVSFVVVVAGLVCTVAFVPETLPPQVAQEARRRRYGDVDQETSNEQDVVWWRTCLESARTGAVRPVKEMSILNRNNFFRLVSILAFFSGMVSSGDGVLLTYYIQERLGFTETDVSTVLLISGIMGLLSQGILLKPLNECVGEKMVIALCFFLGAVDNVMYGLARNKVTIFAAVTLSSLTGMAFPTISAIKANNVDAAEQGRIQGALYSLQALASGLGPALLRFVQSKTEDGALGPGSMFVFAGFLYLFAAGVACALPKELTNASQGNDDDDGDYCLLASVNEPVGCIENSTTPISL